MAKHLGLQLATMLYPLSALMVCEYNTICDGKNQGMKTLAIYKTPNIRCTFHQHMSTYMEVLHCGSC